MTSSRILAYNAVSAYQNVYNKLIENDKTIEAKVMLDSPETRINPNIQESFTKYQTYLTNFLNQFSIEA